MPGLGRAGLRRAGSPGPRTASLHSPTDSFSQTLIQLNALHRFSDRTARLSHAVAALRDARSTAFVLGTALAALPQVCGGSAAPSAPEERRQQRRAPRTGTADNYHIPLPQRRDDTGKEAAASLEPHSAAPGAARGPTQPLCLRGEQKAAVPPTPRGARLARAAGTHLGELPPEAEALHHGPGRAAPQGASGGRAASAAQGAEAGPGHPRPQRSGRSIAGSPRGGRGATRPHRSAPALEAAPPTRPGPAPPAADRRQPAAGTRTRRRPEPVRRRGPARRDHPELRTGPGRGALPAVAPRRRPGTEGRPRGAERYGRGCAEPRRVAVLCCAWDAARTARLRRTKLRPCANGGAERREARARFQHRLARPSLPPHIPAREV